MPAKAFYGKRARSQRDAPSAGTSANTDTDTMSTPSTPQKANKGQMPTAMHDGVVPRSFSSPISSHSSLMPKLKAGGGGGGCSRANRRVLKPTTSARQEQEQLVLDFGQRIRVTCAACGMSYDRSAPEDMALHQKHHERMTKGVEWTAKALHVAGEEVGRMTLSAATVAKIGGGMGRGGGNKANKDNLGLGLDANVVRILQYSLDTQGGASPSSDAVVMRKLNEVMGSMDEALGAAPLSDKIRRACKVFVAVRAGRVMGAAVVGRVEKGAARRVVSPRDGGGGKGAMIADEDAQGEESSMRVYDAGDAIFVS